MFLWKYLTTFFKNIYRLDLLGVQDTDSCRVHISKVFLTFHRLPVGSLWFPLVSMGQSRKGDGSCASEGKSELKAQRDGGSKYVFVGLCWSVGDKLWLDSLMLWHGEKWRLGEVKRTSYPRGPGAVGGQKRGVNCRGLLSALMQGLEKAEGAVRPSWSRFSTCHSSGLRLKPRTALSGWAPTVNSAVPMLTLMRWLGSIGRTARHRRQPARCVV